MRVLTVLAIVSSFALAFSLSACESESTGDKKAAENPSEATNGETDQTGRVGETANGETDQNTSPVAGGATCQYDESQKGQIEGKSIENFGLKTYEGEPYWLHENCGKKKAVWIILATGW